MLKAIGLRDRITAAAVHLLISMFVAAAAAVIVFFVWYPYPLNAAIGANGLFLLILAVDVTLGPLLTFVVFNRAKRSLRFDLGVVACFQIAALVYGLHTMFVGKPAYVTFNQDRFFVVRVGDIDASWYARAGTHASFASTDRFLAPRFAAVKWPEDIAARNDLLFSDSSTRVDAYVPLEIMLADVKRAAKPVDQLRAFNPHGSDDLETLRKTWASRGVKELGFVPLRAQQEDLVVLVDMSTAKVLEIARFKPWH